MREISKHSPGSPFSKLAVLAAINIAHELVQAKHTAQVTETALDGKTQEMIKSIEAILKTSPTE